MADFDELAPGSPEAKAKGCICAPSKSDAFRPNNACPMHGTDALARAVDEAGDNLDRLAEIGKKLNS